LDLLEIRLACGSFIPKITSGEFGLFPYSVFFVGGIMVGCRLGGGRPGILRQRYKPKVPTSVPVPGSIDPIIPGQCLKVVRQLSKNLPWSLYYLREILDKKVRLPRHPEKVTKEEKDREKAQPQNEIAEPYAGNYGAAIK
jgi:hypothetical protein